MEHNKRWEAPVSFLLALSLSVLVFNLALWETVGETLRGAGTISGSVQSFLFLPAYLFLPFLRGFDAPVPIFAFLLPPAVLIIWTVIFFGITVLTRRIFPNAGRLK